MNPRIEVHYQTLSLPPPYAYAYTLRAELTAQAVAITLDWRYTDRDELSEEEIEEEGFTLDDDVQWQGSLPSVWKTALRQLLDHTTLLPQKSAAPERGSWRVTLTDAQAKVSTGIPDNLPQWDYQLQEVIQAVYEAAQRERPLRIRYRDSERSEPFEVTVDICFLHRRGTVTTRRMSQTQSQKLPWHRVPLLLESLYLPDYDAEQSSAAYPRQPGQYLDPGDERWYQLGKSVLNPGKKDVLSMLHQTLLAIASIH